MTHSFLTSSDVQSWLVVAKGGEPPLQIPKSICLSQLSDSWGRSHHSSVVGKRWDGTPEIGELFPPDLVVPNSWKSHSFTLESVQYVTYWAPAT